jgi:hypothetical protein
MTAAQLAVHAATVVVAVEVVESDVAAVGARFPDLVADALAFGAGVSVIVASFAAVRAGLDLGTAGRPECLLSCWCQELACPSRSPAKRPACACELAFRLAVMLEFGFSLPPQDHG